MILFHLTKYENFDSIKQKGLIPNYTKGLASNKLWNNYCVWLTDSPQWIINEQAGERYIKRNNVRVLAVDTSSLTVYSKIGHYFLIPSTYEFVCFETISPKFILNFD